MPADLASALVAAAAPELRARLAEVPALEARLAALVAAGAEAWPQLALTPALLVAQIGRHLDDQADVGELGEALDGLRGGDLHLAAACAAGLPAALEVFERQYMREVDIALAKMRIGPPRLHDVQQLVRQRLFVATPAVGDKAAAPGKIVEYAGRGDLRRWVRAVAVRTCLNDLRRGKHEVVAGDDQLIAQQAMPGDDPEVAYMKRTYAAEFRAAFGEALAALPAREQTLLRYHHVDGLNIDEIGAIYRIHRVTAFRWLEKAREQLVAATLEVLRGRLKLSGPELQSVLRMIRSQVHLSLVRHLGGANDVRAAAGDDDGAEELDPAELEELAE
ncbi:MAG: sigma-70 family RNA polymerase sigma factor [Kofleriaceae bacterium]